jgi:hypothetical protein
MRKTTKTITCDACEQPMTEAQFTLTLRKEPQDYDGKKDLFFDTDYDLCARCQRTFNIQRACGMNKYFLKDDASLELKDDVSIKMYADPTKGKLDSNNRTEKKSP